MDIHTVLFLSSRYMRPLFIGYALGISRISILTLGI